MQNEWIEERSRLQPEEMGKKTLRYICTTFGHRAFALEEFLREAPLDVPPAAWHIGLIQLCHSHIVRMMRKSWGERVYQVPVDAYFQQFPACWPMIVERADDQSSADDLIIHCDTHRSMTEQVLAAIIAMDREPLLLTRQGKLHKKSLERMESSLLWTPGLTEEVRSRLLMETIDLVLRTGLACKTEGTIMLDETRVKGWLMLDAGLRDEQMFLLWYRVHCPDQPGLHWLTGAVFCQADERWLPLAELMNAAWRHGVSLDERAAEEWLLRMQTSGWLELGTDELGRRWVRRRERYRAGERTLVVQSDYEIIALPDTPFEVIRKLHQIGERLDWGAMQQYRLSRDSVQSAARRGWQAAEIIGLLKGYALDELPEHLGRSIHQWVEELSGIRVYQGTVLEVSDRRAAALLEWQRPELPIRPLNERYWLAEGLSAEEVMKLLASKGMAATMNLGPETQSECCVSALESSTENFTLSMEEALMPRAPGLFSPRDSSVLYREEQPSSLLDEVYPDYRKIPASWYEQYRRYHHSTAKQLIEQAMRWRTGVRLRIAGEDHVVVPHQLEERDGVWTMEGSSGSMRIAIKVGEIELLKLLMPGLME